MILIRPLMIFAVLVLISLLTSCAKVPLVTLHQLDTKHGVANPFKITKYNEDTCKIEGTELEPFQIMSTQLHGGFCVTKEDAAKLKAAWQTDCRNRRDEKKRNFNQP